MEAVDTGHVSLITLGVADLARAEAFYRALGWRRSDTSVDGVVSFMRGGALVLSLWVTSSPRMPDSDPRRWLGARPRSRWPATCPTRRRSTPHWRLRKRLAGA